MSCGAGQRRGSDLVWLWPWCRPAATAPIGHPAWKLPYAAAVVLKKQQKKLFCETSISLKCVCVCVCVCVYTQVHALWLGHDAKDFFFFNLQ